MGTHLQHLKFIRERLNDHEDKVAWLSAEQSEQQTHIRCLEQDLQSTRAKIDTAKEEIDVLLKETGHTSKLIVDRRKQLEDLDGDSRTISQAWELINKDMPKQLSRLHDNKSFYEKREADARDQLEQHQAHYESIRRETMEPDANTGLVTEKAPGAEQANDHGVTNIADIEMVEADDDRSEVGSELRRQQLQEEIHQVEDELERAVFHNDQLRAGFCKLEESLESLKEEKLAEEDFLRTLQDRAEAVEQLKGYSQSLVCGTCKHAHIIKYESSKVVVSLA